jgi:hypothetical protein
MGQSQKFASGTGRIAADQAFWQHAAAAQQRAFTIYIVKTDTWLNAFATTSLQNVR